MDFNKIFHLTSLASCRFINRPTQNMRLLLPNKLIWTMTGNANGMKQNGNVTLEEPKLCIPTDKCHIKLELLNKKSNSYSTSTGNKFVKQKKFFDWVRIKVKGGDGGSGSTHTNKSYSAGGPDGGNGGSGGNVIVVASKNYGQLKHIERHYHAGNGGRGSKNHCKGKNAADITIDVPLGTTIKDFETSEVLSDLIFEGEKYTVAKGGLGGIGNSLFKIPINKEYIEGTPGEEGERNTISLEMKTIADVGLVGFPNAGKSTLLRALSNATPTVAAYPFTTLRPYIGRIEYKDHLQIAVADIPGLIEGAHRNKGLGHSFLRHIERCSFLAFVVDLNEEGPVEKLSILMKELELYKTELAKLPSLLIANKIDVVENYEYHLNQLENVISMPVIGVSGKQNTNIKELKTLLRNKLYEKSNLA